MHSEAANRILDDALAVGPRCGSTHVIAIDGPTGCGKTTLAEAVCTVADARTLDCSVIHTDDVCPGWEGLSAVPGIIEALLRRLAGGGDATYPTWDWHADRPGPDAVCKPTDILIIEGVGSGARRCAPLLSARVLLDAPAALRKDRALTRDGDTFAPYWDVWARAEAQYFSAEGSP